MNEDQRVYCPLIDDAQALNSALLRTPISFCSMRPRIRFSFPGISVDHGYCAWWPRNINVVSTAISSSEDLAVICRFSSSRFPRTSCRFITGTSRQPFSPPRGSYSGIFCAEKRCLYGVQAHSGYAVDVEDYFVRRLCNE